MTRIKTLFLACALLGSSRAVATDVPQPNVTLHVSPQCRGVCSPKIVPLADDNKAVVLWIGEQLVPFAQVADLQTGKLLGSAVSMSTPVGASASLDQPVPVALPGGDLALVSALRDGRISVMRGSENASRRFAPQVVSPASELEVVELAAAAVSDGLAILVLRGAHREDLRDPRRSIDYEMIWLDAAGHAKHPSVHWKGAVGYSPRIATCGGRQYLAWLSNEGLVTSSFSAAYERSAEQVLRFGNGVAANSGPLLCTADGARFASGWRKDPTALELNPELRVVDLGPKVAQPAWKMIKLPEPPYVHRDWLEVHETSAGTQLVVQGRTGARLVTLKNDQVTPGTSLPKNASCVATHDGTRAACAETQRRVIKEGKCNRGEYSIDLRLYGASVAGSPAQPSYAYWNTAPIADAGAPAAWERARDAALLKCSMPEFAPLRDALSAWCTDPKLKPTADQGYLAFCDEKEATSLLSQAKTCTARANDCSPAASIDLPSVDRKSFERGKRVELGYLNCAVWFTRSAKGWRVVDHECEGD